MTLLLKVIRFLIWEAKRGEDGDEENSDNS